MFDDHETSKAFTLIELLVVIAIILLLAAIMFPVFAQARAKAYQAQCSSNLRQIGMAVLMYAQDNDETLMAGQHRMTPLPGTPVPVPPATYPPASYYGGWAGPSYGYVRAPGVFRCPTDASPDGTVGTEPAWAVTYFFSSELGAGAVPGGLPLAAIGYPDRTILVAESTADTGSPSSLVRLQNPLEEESAFANSFTATGEGHDRHQGGRNFLLADGHVRRLRPEAVSTAVPDSAPAVPPLPPDQLPPGVVATFAYH